MPFPSKRAWLIILLSALGAGSAVHVLAQTNAIGELTWTPDQNLEPGGYTIAVTATDSTGNTQQQNVTITVLPQETAPPAPEPTPVLPAETAGSHGDSDSSEGGGGGGGGPDPEPPTLTPTPRRSAVAGVNTKISLADRAAADFIDSKKVPYIVEQLFVRVYRRRPTSAESDYWKARARGDKATERKLHGAMAWHNSRGSTGVKTKARVAGAVETFIPTSLVPAYVERVFKEMHGRKPTTAESAYWKQRVRTDKKAEVALKGAMAWHKERGSTGVEPSLLRRVKGATTSLVARVNSIFRSVYARNPTGPENTYWVSRVKDKVTEIALRGAILFHKQQGIEH